MKKFVVLISFLVVACALGPDYKRPEFFSDENVIKALNITPVQAKVFTPLDFNDATLNELIDMAIKNNPSYRSAMISVRQARANVKIAQAQLAPTFDASGKYNYLKADNQTRLVLDEDYYQTGLDASWELDIFGGTRRRIEAQTAEMKQRIFNVQNVYVSLVSEVANSYINLKTTQALIVETKNNIELQRKQNQLVQDKFDSGLSNNLDLSQSLYLLNTTEASLSELMYQEEVYKNSLALLVGKLPNSLDDMLGAYNQNVINQPIGYDINQIYQLPASVVRNRPDVKAEEQMLVAQNALIGAYIADMFPSVSLSAVFGFEALNPSGLFNRSNFVYSYAPQIGMPIFHFGALKNRVEAQKLATEIAVNNYEQSILNGAGEIKNAMIGINTQTDRNQKLKASYEHANQATILTQDKYKNGLIEYSEVLKSEQDRISAQSDMIKSNGMLYQNLITFYKSVGGKFDE